MNEWLHFLGLHHPYIGHRDSPFLRNLMSYCLLFRFSESVNVVLLFWFHSWSFFSGFSFLQTNSSLLILNLSLFTHLHRCHEGDSYFIWSYCLSIISYIGLSKCTFTYSKVSFAPQLIKLRLPYSHKKFALWGRGGKGPYLSKNFGTRKIIGAE